MANAAGYGGDATRLAVGGDSAGGNLAAAVLVEANKYGGPAIKVGVLLYGVFDYHRAMSDLGWAGPKMQLYLANDEYDGLKGDYRVSPFYNCDEFLPCYPGVGTKDPLVQESLTFAKTLFEKGIEHDLHVLEDAPHGFFQLPPLEVYINGYQRATAFMDRHINS